VFTDRVRASLTLVVGSSTFAFPSGSFEDFSIEALPHSFRASASVYVSSELDTDELFEPFTSDALIKATLSVASCVLEGSGEEVPPIQVTGYVTEKNMVEDVSDDVDSKPVVGRTYRVFFSDAASVFWKQHHPLELHVDSSMQEVIELHKLQGMEITYDWTRLGARQDVLLVATGVEGGASFYDLVVWYIDRHGGVLELDAATGAYRIAGAKARPPEPVELEREYTARLSSPVQRPARYKPRLLNAFSENAQSTPVDNELAHAEVFRDTLLRTPIASDLEVRQHIEAGRLKVSPPALIIDFARLPPQLVQPGMALYLGEDFGERLLASKKNYRVTELHLRARATVGGEGEEVPELTDPTCSFEVSMSASLEQSSDPLPRLPPFTPPRYPVLVEGKIVSDGGGDDDRTWMIATSKDELTRRYTVQIPLWNKKVPAPFEPNHVPGHMFFPAYKHQRVLVALTFSTAAIRRHLDWAANARTPLDGQGNRLVLGHQALDGVVIDHIYKDSKPVFSIKRTFGNDLQTLEVKDGTIYWEVREDETAQELEPRYDVTVVVTASKEQVKGEVQGAIDQVTGSFEGAMGDASDHLDAEVEELSGAVGAAEATLTSKIEAVNAQLEEISGSLAAVTDEISAAVASAKAELNAALK